MTGSMWTAQVGTGTPRDLVCPVCSEDRTDAAVYGLTADGVLHLGTLTSCDGCGAWWQCALCPAALPMDGTSAYLHVTARHGWT